MANAVKITQGKNCVTGDGGSAVGTILEGGCHKSDKRR